MRETVCWGRADRVRSWSKVSIYGERFPLYLRLVRFGGSTYEQEGSESSEATSSRWDQSPFPRILEATGPPDHP